MDASGLVVWVGNADGADLRPVVAHGYSPAMVARIGPVPRSANNAAAAAYAIGTLQVVPSRPATRPAPSSRRSWRPMAALARCQRRSAAARARTASGLRGHLRRPSGERARRRRPRRRRHRMAVRRAVPAPPPRQRFDLRRHRLSFLSRTIPTPRFRRRSQTRGAQPRHADAVTEDRRYNTGFEPRRARQATVSYRRDE